MVTRTLLETAMYRLKQLSPKNYNAQAVETYT